MEMLQGNVCKKLVEDGVESKCWKPSAHSETLVRVDTDSEIERLAGVEPNFATKTKFATLSAADADVGSMGDNTPWTRAADLDGIDAAADTLLAASNESNESSELGGTEKVELRRMPGAFDSHETGESRSQIGATVCF